MEYRLLGRTGLRVSVLSIGAMTFGDGGVFMKGATSSNDEARQVFDASIDAGVNLVDTADIYSNGGSEVLTGEWIRGKRDTVLLATKCRFPSGPGPNGGGATRHHIVRSCEASLKRLGTDVIDLYQIHMQDSATPIEETMRALDDLVTSGKVRYVGCSNYTGYRLTEALWASDKRNQVRFESVQLQGSLATRDCEREMIPASMTAPQRPPAPASRSGATPGSALRPSATSGSSTRCGPSQPSAARRWPRWRSRGCWRGPRPARSSSAPAPSSSSMETSPRSR